MIDTSSLSEDLRSYLPLYLKAFNESGLNFPSTVRWVHDNGQESIAIQRLKDGGQFVPHQMVVAQLEADTQSVSASLGFGSHGPFHPGSFSQYVVINLQVSAFYAHH
jgi:hypothetical protein